MIARCTKCSKHSRFRHYRGSKLSDQKCSCGGKLEIVGGSHALSGKHPFDQKSTHTSDWFEGEYYYAEANRKKQYFVYHEGYYHLIENPVFPKRKNGNQDNTDNFYPGLGGEQRHPDSGEIVNQGLKILINMKNLFTLVLSTDRKFFTQLSRLNDTGEENG